MNELAVRNNQAEISKILNSEAGDKRLNDFFNGDKEKVQRFKTSLINIAGNYVLSQCSPNSIIRSAFALADIGLDINQNLKQAYILKYADDAEPVVSYKGWQVLLRKGGKNTRAFCVYRCDKFTLDYNSFEGNLEFQPNYQERDETNREWFNNNLLGVVVRIKDVKCGLDEVFFVSGKKIDKIKGYSPSVRKGKRNPYDDWFEEMYLAKAIKYVLSKQAFTFEDEKLSEAIEMENNVEAKIQQNEQKNDIKDFEELLLSDYEVRDMVKNPESEIEIIEAE